MSISPNLGKYIPLRSVVAMYLDENDKSGGDQDKCWLLGLRGLTELNIDISAEPLTVRLPVQSNKTVKFPSDCIQWTKIGVLNSAGEMSTLKINRGLTTYKDNNPNRIESLTPDINDSASNLSNSPVFLNYYTNNGYYNLFGVGNGLIQYGQCRIDDKNGLVVLAPDFQYDSILFEYISAPQRNEEYQVELILQEAIIAFIAWKMKTGTAQQYYGEVTKARRRLPGKKVTLQGINQVIRESESGKLRS